MTFDGRVHNSTLRRHVRLDRGGTPLRPNTERRKRKRTEYDEKLRKYRRSATYRAVKARAGGQCEWTAPHSGRRCEQTEFLEHHHKRYLRFGGDELPNDVIVLCRTHHQYEDRHKLRGRGGRR
jgi:hypothetical protein